MLDGTRRCFVIRPREQPPSAQNFTSISSWYVAALLACVAIACIVYKLHFPDPSSQVVAEVAHDVTHPKPITSPVQTAPRKPTYSREQETCDSMARLFGVPFVKVRPAFLINPESGRRLEIDCYNDELKVGAEFNGIGHYKYPNPFHKTEAEFHAQVRRDEYKKNICVEQGISLYVVPDSVRKGDIYEYLNKLIYAPSKAT